MQHGGRRHSLEMAGGKLPRLPEIRSLQAVREPVSTEDVVGALEPYFPAWRSAPQQATVVLRQLASWQPALAALVLRSMAVGQVETNNIHWNAVVFEAAKAKDWERAFALVNELPGANLSCEINCYNAVLSAAVCTDKWPLALAMLSHRFEMFVSADAVSFNVVADAVAKQGVWRQVAEILRAMSSEQTLPDAVTYNAGMCPKTLQQEWALVFHFLLRMQFSHVESDMANIGAAVNVCGDAFQWKSACGLLEGAARTTLRLNLVSINAAISGMCSGGASTAVLGCRSF